MRVFFFIASRDLENALLLSPENYDLPVLGNDRFTLDSFSAVQRRICFTELEPEELQKRFNARGIEVIRASDVKNLKTS